MMRRKSLAAIVLPLCAAAAGVVAAKPAFAQVSPAEVSSTKLRSLEQKHLQELKLLHRAIVDTKFPFAVYLTRYVTADPEKQVTFDSRGIEFVNFQNDVVLKTSAIYRAAYNSDQLTQNERAAHTLRDVITPILGLVADQIPPDIECDAIGFEIAYHTHSPNKSYEFEGKEILAVVLVRDDAFAYAKTADEEQRQGILNRSLIYVNGKEFGLALGDRNPLSPDDRALSAPPALPPRGSSSAGSSSSARNSLEGMRSNAGTQATGRFDLAERSPHASPGISAAAAPAVPAADPKPAATPADAERLQARYQAQLDALMKDGVEKFHLVEYAPPAFAIYHDRLALQLTLRNTLAFEKNSGSIYKRAAQTFDLFLAPELKGLLQKLPADAEIDALDFSVLNRLGNEKTSSEAVEFVCPLKSLRAFANDEITGQDLVNQSIILVNGVRIALNLQLVE
jgi:hypothetical protein